MHVLLFLSVEKFKTQLYAFADTAEAVSETPGITGNASTLPVISNFRYCRRHIHVAGI